MSPLRFFLLLALVVTVPAFGAAPPSPTQSESALSPTHSERARLAQVSSRLLAADPTGRSDRPLFTFAGKGPDPIAVLHQKGPLVCVPPELMSRIGANQEDALALLLGQAVAHAWHGDAPARDPLSPRKPYSAEQVERADRRAAELMLRAGYSLASARRVLIRRPGWEERFDRLYRDQAVLSRTSAAFREGVLFLVTQQYALAELCFEWAVKEFVGSPEAWGCLGYTRLMRYFDGWSQEDLREAGVGMVAVPAFRKRIEEQRPLVRGKNSKLWWDALDALEESIRQKPEQIDARIAVGLAYLFHPEKKDPARAVKALKQAVAAADTAKAPAAKRAEAVLALAVGRLAGGEVKEGLAALATAEALARGGPPSLRAAVLFNRACVQAAKGEKEKACALLESFLKTSDTGSYWWVRAEEQYEELCLALGRKRLAREVLVRRGAGPTTRARVRLAGGKEVSAGDEVEGLAKILGPWERMRILGGMHLARLIPRKHSLALVATDQVLAVCPGPGSAVVGLGKADSLRVGAATADVDRLLGQEYHIQDLAGAEGAYCFYPESGVAVRLVGGKVVAVVLVRVPGR